MNKITWILLANSSRARLFAWDRADAQLQEISDFVHPQGRQKVAEIDPHLGGHTQRPRGDGASGGAAFEPRTDPRHKEREHFARELAAYLDAALETGRFGSLVLIASNPFLGELRAHLADRVDKRVQAVVHSDLSSLGLAELTRRVAILTQPLH
jgi:protein required for attachment to host cells